MTVQLMVFRTQLAAKAPQTSRRVKSGCRKRPGDEVRDRRRRSVNGWGRLSEDVRPDEPLGLEGRVSEPVGVADP